VEWQRLGKTLSFQLVVAIELDDLPADNLLQQQIRAGGVVGALDRAIWRAACCNADSKSSAASDSLKNGSSCRAGSVFCIASLSILRIGDARADIYGLSTISYITALNAR
jgi:hypothetical protein